jgi:hypothetical protein
MYPICEIVEYASTRLMSYSVAAMSAAQSAVSAPIQPTTCSAAPPDASNTGDRRATM